jgi:hypothetical protein
VPHTTHRQPWIIQPNRFRADKNCVYVRAKLVRVTTGTKARNPTRLTWVARQSTIEAHAAFSDHKRPPSNNPFVESLVKSRAVVGQDAIAYFDARIS